MNTIRTTMVNIYIPSIFSTNSTEELIAIEAMDGNKVTARRMFARNTPKLREVLNSVGISWPGIGSNWRREDAEQFGDLGLDATAQPIEVGLPGVVMQHTSEKMLAVTCGERTTLFRNPETQLLVLFDRLGVKCSSLPRYFFDADSAINEFGGMSNITRVA